MGTTIGLSGEEVMATAREQAEEAVLNMLPDHQWVEPRLARQAAGVASDVWEPLLHKALAVMTHMQAGADEFNSCSTCSASIVEIGKALGT